MSDEELINYLVWKANKLGREGTKVIGWVPSASASQDWRGRLVTIPFPRQKFGSDSDD